MDEWKSRLVIKSMLPHFSMVGNRQEPRKLQESGPTKRRQEGDSFQFPGMADGDYPNKVKRPCLEDVTFAMGQGVHPSTPCAELQVPPMTMNPTPAAMGVPGQPVPSQPLVLESNPMNGSMMGPPYVAPPTPDVGLKAPTAPYYDKVNSVPAVDQELQELLEELTKIQEPSPSEIDLEKILGSKPEEPVVLDHPQATLGTTPKPPVQMPHVESPTSSKEFAASCSQVPGVPLQMPPSSTGISYPIPSTSKQMVSPSSSTAQAKNQAQAMHPVAVPPLPVPQWHHAHQLKALAASKQGSATKQPVPPPSWSGMPPPGLSPGLSPPYRPVPSPHPGNTKPLSHFVSEPSPPKIPSVPATSRQPSLLHYLQQPTPSPASSATASSTATATLQLQQQPDHALLLQQVMQQPQRFHRSVAPDSMAAVPRQQEKQRSGLMAMTPEKQSACIAQQMSQFQAVQEQFTSKSSQTKASPSSCQYMMPPRTGLFQNHPSPGMIPPTGRQSLEGMDMISPTPGKQQGIFDSGPRFPPPSSLGQNPLSSPDSVCQRPQSPKTTSPGLPLPGFCPGPLGSPSLSPHQPSQPSVPTVSTVFNSAAWFSATAAETAAVSREPLPSQVDTSLQPHLDSNSIFAKVSVKVPPLTPASQQAAVAALANPSFSLLGNPSLRQSPVRGPVPGPNPTKSLQQGVASFNPMSPVQGFEPPSYVAAAAAATASVIAASQLSGPFNRTGTPLEPPPDSFLPQPPLNGLISPPDCGEVDFIEALLKGSSVGPDEDWVCNLRLIDDILGQHAAAQNATAQNASQLVQDVEAVEI
ncbi:mastermind-like domain-containing protein 1 [Carlito syrichta]|uniref:Mastermind-like domain-containing protein 1 n=1 Tax=Carlito syrichta TaxID=1868482 RepID=A0A3Q0DXQ3_CARSF|nr:mastermind-like domain-containing protein 1 [Carlito syrichta]